MVNIIDTGANNIVVNDARLLIYLKITSAETKGVDGKSIGISGVRRLKLSLESDSGQVDTSLGLKAVFVTSCPYNRIQYQI